MGEGAEDLSQLCEKSLCFVYNVGHILFDHNVIRNFDKKCPTLDMYGAGRKSLQLKGLEGCFSPVRMAWGLLLVRAVTPALARAIPAYDLPRACGQVAARARS